jgi:carbamoyl-phosphate synthase large subunit
MNVLLTCAGRRNYLVRFFADALRRAGGGRVVAADASADAPALADADVGYRVPRIDAPDYLDVLAAVVEAEAIDLVVSLNDLELPLLARNRDRFAALGARAVVSAPDVIEACFDKHRTVSVLRDLGVETPATFLSAGDALDAVAEGRLSFPLVVKPRWGSASIGVDVVGGERDLRLAVELAEVRLAASILAGAGAEGEPGVLIQERLGGPEYGLDVVNDLDGRHATTFVKEKIGMRGGETDRARTVDRPALVALGRRIGEGLGHVGNLDCDVFLRDGEPVVLEMNPRFGGGYPFSHHAGADLPSALLAWHAGRQPLGDWLSVETGRTFAKFDLLADVGGTPVRSAAQPALL